MTPNDGECPYGAGDCPRMKRAEARIEKMENSILEIRRLLYIIVGVLMIECGLVII